MEEMINFLNAHEVELAALGVISVVTFFVSLLILPIIILALPADYFVRPFGIPKNAGVLYWSARFLKNLFGLIIFILGIAMLVLPGQGILGILLGLGLIDFPGKRRLELRMLGNRRVQRTVNWVRLKGGKAPLVVSTNSVPPTCRDL